MTSQEEAQKHSIPMTCHYPDQEGSASDWLKICFNQSEALSSSGQFHAISQPRPQEKGKALGTRLVISMAFLRSFPRLHFAGKQVVTSRNVGCFLKLKSMFIQSVLGVNRKYYGQRQNSESAILRLSVRLGRFCSELHYGAFFGAKSLPFLASTKLRRTLGQTSSPKTKQKRKNTVYLSHKNPFNGLTIIFNAMKFLTLVFFYRPVTTTVLYFLSFEFILYSSRYFHQLLLRHFFVAKRQARNAVTSHKRPWEGERRKPSPTFLCAHIFMERYFSGYEAGISTYCVRGLWSSLVFFFCLIRSL